jgi:hypothetical protein
LSVLAQSDRADGACEDEPSQVRGDGGFENVAQAVHIGAEQRGRVTEPGPGVDDAVVDVVAAGHRAAQRRVVEDIAVVPLEFEVVQRKGRAGAPQQDSHPLATLYQLSCDVRSQNPLAPSTSFTAT